MRHTAFKRGTAYLERYCMLIVFAAYLERNRQAGHALSFRQWVASRPDIMSARPRARRARPFVPPGQPAPATAAPDAGGCACVRGEGRAARRARPLHTAAPCTYLPLAEAPLAHCYGCCCLVAGGAAACPGRPTHGAAVLPAPQNEHLALLAHAQPHGHPALNSHARRGCR